MSDTRTIYAGRIHPDSWGMLALMAKQDGIPVEEFLSRVIPTLYSLRECAGDNADIEVFVEGTEKKRSVPCRFDKKTA